MKKWILAIVLLLTVCFTACFAAADGTEMELPDGEKVTMTPRVVQRLSQNTGSVTVSTPVGTNVGAIRISVKDAADWSVVDLNLQGEEVQTVNGKNSIAFTFGTGKASKFKTGHQYLVELMAMPTANSAPAEWKGYWSQILTIVPEDAAGLQLYLNEYDPKTDTTEVMAGTPSLYATAYDNNAKSVWIILDGEAIQGQKDSNSVTVNARFDEAGTHTIRAVSMDINGSIHSSEEKTFTVAFKDQNPALYGENVVPVTFADGNGTKSLDEFPETLQAGTGISYTIHRVTRDLGTDEQGLDEQIRYDSWLDDLTEWDPDLELPCYQKRHEPNVAQGLLLNEETGDQTVTIDGSKLKQGHTYQLNVQITASGFTPVIYSKNFVVLPTTLNNQNFIFSFSGNDAGQTSITVPIYEEYDFYMKAPGATILRIWTGDRYEYMPGPEAHFTHKTWGEGTYQYFFQAYYNEPGETPWDQLNWEAKFTSNILTVNATRDKNAGTIAPVFEALSNTVTQGDYFTVEITNADELNAAQIYFGANLYNCWRMIDNYFSHTGNSISVPTADLDPGYYTLAIFTETTGAGYAQNWHVFRVLPNQNITDDNYADNDYFIMTTTVQPDQEGKRTVASYEDFGVTFYAPDREGYTKYYRFFDGQSWWWDSWFERSVTLDADLDPGTWQIYAEVVYEPEDRSKPDIRIQSVPIEITATITGNHNGESGIMLDAPGSYILDNNSDGYTVQIKDSINDILIDPAQYADEYWELVLEDRENGEELARFRRDNGNTLQNSFTFPKNLFTAGKNYKIRFHLNILGYNPVDDEISFVAVDPAAVNSQKLVLTVNEYNTGSYVSWIPANEEINVKVTKSKDITAVRVLNGDHWDYWFGNDSYDRDWRFGVGIYGFVAQGTTQNPVWEEEGFDWGRFDWERDVNWSITSNTVTVRFNAENGRLERPTLSIDKTTYTRGEPVVATIGKVNNSERYGIHICPVDENGEQCGPEVYDSYTEETGTGELTFTIRTEHIEPGRYGIRADNNGIGYQGNNSVMIPFEIKNGSGAPTAVLDLPSEISTNQNITIYAFVPNADDIWLDIRKQGETGWRQDRNSGGNYAEWEFGEAFRGTYLFTLYAHVNGEEIQAVGPKALEVKASRGDLNDVTFSGLPGTITISQSGGSEGVSGTFSIDSRAAWYQVRLVYRGPTGDWGDDEIRSDFREGSRLHNGIAYDKTDFNRGTGVYEVQVIGGATGYNGTDNRWKILAMEATQGTIELTILKDDGTSETNITAQANENLNVRIHAPGATAIRLFDGERWEWWDGRCLNMNGWAEFRRSHDAGQYTLVAQAAYDEGYDWDSFDDWENFDAYRDLHWTATSNEVHVSLTAEGKADAPVLAEISPVTRGELVAVTVLSAGESNSPSRGTSLDAFIQHEDGWNVGDGIGTGALETGDYPYTFLFPTGNMEPGQYTVRVHSHALGYNTAWAYMTFEVVEPEDDPFIFEVQDGMDADQDFSLSAYAPGASWIDVYLYREGDDQPFSWGPFPGEYVYNTRAKLDGGEYVIWAIAHYTDEQGNETGTRRSADISRTIFYQDRLADPVIHAENTYIATVGGSFTVDFGNTEDCHWWVEVYDKDEEEEWEDGSRGWALVARWDSDGEMPESFPLSIQDLISGHSYHINAGINRNGFEGGFSWKDFAAIGAASSDVVLSVEESGGYALDHWPSSRNLRTTVHAPGSTAVRVWYNGNWDYRDSRGMNQSGDYIFDCNYNDVGEYTLVAQACYDKNINWDNVDFSTFDWNSLDWAETSNTIDINVFANGQATAPTFTAPTAVRIGESIEITITNIQTDQWYGATLRTPDGRNASDYTGMDRETNKITIPTDNVAGGAYKLCIWADAEGKLGQEAYAGIVIDNLAGASVFTLPAGITEVEADAFEGVRMEVVVIQGNHPTLDLNFLEGTGTRYLVVDSGSVTIPRYHSYTVITPADYNELK